MEQVRRSLQEFEEKATELKKVHNNEYLKIKLDRTKADIKKMKLQHQTDTDISFDRDQLDKAEKEELAAFAKRIEKEQVAQLKKALNDQRALFAHMISKERAIADEVLQKTRQEYDENMKTQQQTIDSLSNQARSQLEGLQNDCSKLKGLTDNLNVEVTTVLF